MEVPLLFKGAFFPVALAAKGWLAVQPRRHGRAGGASYADHAGQEKSLSAGVVASPPQTTSAKPIKALFCLHSCIHTWAFANILMSAGMYDFFPHPWLIHSALLARHSAEETWPKFGVVCLETAFTNLN